MLDYIALGMIFFLIIAAACVVVWLGSLPANIARRRGHPYPDAVNVASWMGIFTVILWPLVFIWAFLPHPRPHGSTADEAQDDGDRSLEERITALEAIVRQQQAQQTGETS